MVGRELTVRKEAVMNLREVAARTTLREVRQKGHMYVELRHVGKRTIFFCTLCLTPCYSDTVLFDHLQGHLHARRLAAAKATLFGATPWPFSDGVLFFDNSRESNMLLTTGSSTDDEVASRFDLVDASSPNNGCSANGSNGNASASNGSPDAQLSLVVKTSLGSSRTVLDMIATRKWSDISLAIPGVLLEEKLSTLAVQHLGVGQIAFRMQDNNDDRGKITRMWCAWLGQVESALSNEVDKSANCDFAIVNFPYAYGLGRKGAPDDEDTPISPGSFFEIDDSGRRKKRKKKSFSDQEECSVSLNESCESLSGGSPSMDTVAAHDSQELERRLLCSKAVRQQLRNQKRLAAERTCDICGQPMLPGKDVAALLNCRTGNLACSSRNTNGAFHPFHASCLIHWILLCELEIWTDPKSRRSTRGRKPRSTLKNRITSILCPECQGTGVSIQGDELEKPNISLSEMFLYKLKAIEANKAWMKNPEILQKCSTGLHFPCTPPENAQENVVPFKLLHFFRAEE